MSDVTKVRKVAHDATAQWLINIGKIGGPSQLNTDRKLSEYGIDVPALIHLSQHVAVATGKKAGKIVMIPADFPHQVSGGTVGHFITAFTALPGIPTTGLDRPIKPPKPR